MKKVLNDLTGKIFHKWKVISREPDRTFPKGGASRMWLCICGCGKTSVVASGNLLAGRSRGCLQCMNMERGKKDRKLSAKKVLFNRKVAKMAPKRGIEVKMDEEDYYKIAKNNCFYCNLEPIETPLYDHGRDTIKVNGVDRLDSSGPYSVDNCVACCKDCNFAKNDQTLDEFLKRIERIYNHLIKEKK